MNKKTYNNKLNIAIDNRKFEIELLWKRTVIFWGFISALFIALSNLINNSKNGIMLSIICLTGLVFSLIWTLANRGSKAWQESWEIKAREYFKNNNNKDIYKKVVEDQDGIVPILKYRHYSLSRLLIALSDFSVIIWFGLSLYFIPYEAIKRIYQDYSSLILCFLYLITLAYIIYILFACRSSDKGISIENFFGGEYNQ